MPIDDVGETSEVSSVISCNHLLTVKTVSRADLLRTRDAKSFTERQLLMIEEMSPVFDQLNVNDSDLQLIQLSFKNICTSLSGMICIEELEFLSELGSSSFNQRVLGTLDAGETGKLDFFEFLIVTWSYCTSGSDNLALFVFRLYCHDDSRKMYISDSPRYVHISSTQLCRMVHDLHGHGLENNFQAHAILNDVNEGLYNFQDFVDFADKHRYLLFPSLQLQQRLRHVVCGEQFWLTHVHQEISPEDLIPSITLMREVQNRYPLVDSVRSSKNPIIGVGRLGWGSRTDRTHTVELISHLHFQLSAICDSSCGLVCRGGRAVVSLTSALRRRIIRSITRSQAVKRLSCRENDSDRYAMGGVQSCTARSRSSRSLMKIRAVRVTPQSDSSSFKIRSNINPISTVPGNSFAPPVDRKNDLDPYETSTMALFRALSQETSSRVLDMDWPSAGQSSFRNPTSSSTIFPSSDQNSWSEPSSAYMSPAVSEKLSGKFVYRGNISSTLRLSSSSSISQERARTPVMSPPSSVKVKRQYHPRTSYLTSLPEIENEQLQTSP